MTDKEKFLGNVETITAKYLKEDNDNEYAKAIHVVEKCMKENDVEFIVYGITIIKIKDKKFRLTKNSSGFPRFVDDERLELIE